MTDNETAVGAKFQGLDSEPVAGFNAIILQLMGLDRERLTYYHHGVE